MSELNTAILAKIGESANKINDYDQRSALGMAYSWLTLGRLETWNAERHKDMIQYPNRDQLAVDLVAILDESGADKDEMAAALAEARRVVNEPFRQAVVVGTAKQKKEKKG